MEGIWRVWEVWVERIGRESWKVGGEDRERAEGSE